MLTQLHKFLINPQTNTSRSQVVFWLCLSLIFATIYGSLALRQAFSGEYVVQDDARQHIFWMRRFLDSTLFPNDLIADYFQSVAPLGYKAFYHSFANIGVEPLWLSKVLPLFLGLITTFYCFGVCVQLLPIPMTGFIGALLLNQNLWMQDALISATPKAFIYPLFLAFLYYLLRRSHIACMIAIALLGLFYPTLIFVCAGILILRLSKRQNFIFCIAGLAVAFLVILPYALNSSTFAPVITVAQARTLPEFLPQGRSSFFFDHEPWRFWFNETRSGIRLTSALMPPLIYAGLLLPIMLHLPSFPLAKKVRDIIILPQMLIASLVMFFAAHALLFKLHLPSRYTQHSFRITMAIAAAIVLTLIIDASGRLMVFKNLGVRLGALVTTALIALALIFYPATLDSFLWTGYVVGEAPALYKFFQQQPQDIIIASLADEVNNLPTFSQRSILTGSEYAVPYHWGYYRRFRQRTLDLIQAQYSQDVIDVRRFIQKYGIDYWLIDANAFTPEYLTERTLNQYQQLTSTAISNLQQGNLPALANITQKCTIFQAGSFIVLQADCIQNLS